jgi:RNA ligase (TIGR02306 family)
LSTLRVEVVAIDRVERHPNADRLDLVGVKGWNCVVGRNEPSEPKYKVGDLAIYVPIDSVLPEKLESYLFPPDSKIKLEKSRVRSIKIRKALSQGMVIDMSPELEDLYPGIAGLSIGADVADKLGITKYEPPEETIPGPMRAGQQSKRNPNFKKYTDIENFKFHTNLFKDGDMVYVTEKLHGTSARYGMLPTANDRWWKKLLKFFGLLPAFEFCYGSRNIQLQSTIRKKVFYDTNVYGEIAHKLELHQRLKPGEVLYGEIVGDGIQKNYTYGCKAGEHEFYAYDVMVDGEFLNSDEFCAWCDHRGIKRVPMMYVGRWDPQIVDKLRCGDSTVGGQKVREGVVIKAAREETGYVGRKVLKYINDDYLLQKDATDFH